jgi:hypothetical protein
MMMLVVIGVTRRVSDLTSSRQALRLTAVMVTAVSLLMVAHFAEILVWSLGYAIVRVAPEGADLVYFAFVNNTTLGYGDVTPLERWRLLGPNDGDERRFVVWLVHRRHFRGAAEGVDPGRERNGRAGLIEAMITSST